MKRLLMELPQYDTFFTSDAIEK